MDVLLSESEMMLRDTARRVADHLACGSVAELEAFDPAVAWKSLQGPGFVGMRLASDVGGGDATTVDQAIVVEALARGPVPLPYLGSVLATELLLAAGASPDVLERVASGDLRCTLAVMRDLSAVAAADTGEVVAFDAADAQVAVMLDAGGSHLRTVAVGQPTRGADLSRMVARVDAAATMDIGSLGDGIGPDALSRFHARALALVSADLVGLMSAALETAVTYAQNRVQFGAPIGSFQAVQQLAADQLVSLEGARSLTEYAAWAADELPVDDALMAARSAKAYASRAGRTLCEAVVQIHGGMGITWDCPAHVYLKRALVDALLLGDYTRQLTALVELRAGRAA
jgi:alkylation response protein AidB-like acyl-CoA dehydrogenase